MDNTVGSRQENVIIGSLLGDGILERNGKHVRLVIDHSDKQKMYVEWIKNQLIPINASVMTKQRFDHRTNKTYNHCILRTHTTPNLEKYVDMFYCKKTKHIPTNLPLIINPQILAVWIMDDGYKRNDCNALRLNTQSFTYDEHLLIKLSLFNLSISTNIQRHKAGFVTYIPSRSMTLLRTLIRPYIIKSMEYKIA